MTADFFRKPRRAVDVDRRTGDPALFRFEVVAAGNDDRSRFRGEDSHLLQDLVRDRQLGKDHQLDRVKACLGQDALAVTAGPLEIAMEIQATPGHERVLGPERLSDENARSFRPGDAVVDRFNREPPLVHKLLVAEVRPEYSESSPNFASRIRPRPGVGGSRLTNVSATLIFLLLPTS